MHQVRLLGRLDRCIHYGDWNDQAKSTNTRLALLQTCRQIYRECIDLLYGPIRALEVSWSGAYFPKGYETPDLALVECPRPENGKVAHGLESWFWMCKVIVERMAGLKSLKVKLFTIWHFRILLEDVERILQPLRQMRDLEVFEVEVNPQARVIEDLASPWRLDELVKDTKYESYGSCGAFGSMSSSRLCSLRVEWS